MRNRDKEIKQQSQTVPGELYSSAGKKSSKKSGASKSQSAQKGAQTRQLRREKALQGVKIEQLLKYLQLEQDSNIICPFCEKHNTLELNTVERSFHCSSCKTKGNSIKLVKKVKGLSDWQAIYYLEELSTKKEENPSPSKEPSTTQAKPSAKKEINSHETSYKTSPGKDRIHRIKANNRLEEVVASAVNVQFKRSGSHLICRCPFSDHEDKNPSFTIKPDKQSYRCYGCGRNGDVISFVMEYRNFSFRETVDYLDPAGVEVKKEIRPQTPIVKHLPQSPANPITAMELARKCQDFFHSHLSESSEAKAFLEERGLLCSLLVKELQLGYDDGRINRAINGDISSILHNMGFTNDKGNSRFYRCLTVGLQDEHGNVVSIYGRRVNNEKGSKHQFPKGNLQGIFNAKVFSASKEIIFSEGIMDAMSIWRMGWRNSSCIFSAGNIPKIIPELLRKRGTKVAYMAFDNDERGNQACELFAKALRELNINLKRIEFPKGIKDANELLMALGLEQATVTFSQLMGKAKEFSYRANNPDPPKKNHHQPVTRLDIPMEVKEGQIEFSLSERNYRIRGLEKNNSFDSLRINIKVFLNERFHIDTLELYNARARSSFIKTAATELGVQAETIKSDIGQILLKLEELQEKQIKSVLEPKTEKIILSKEEQSEAESYLKAPKLLQRVANDYEKCGLVGEKTNILMIYLTITSRKLMDPLAIIIQALSAAGKTTLMNQGLAFAPEEDVIKFTAMTGQSLFYMGEKNLAHKVLAIVEEEGAEKASYSLKIFQSEKSLSMASTGKDPKSGRFVTHEYKVEGPSPLILTTAAAELDEEFANRCVVLTTNEKREQTRLIHQKQREKETLTGQLQEKERQRLIKLHQNIQRLIKPMMVVNPHAKHLTFVDTRLRTRRDHVKYLNIIKTIALLHQYQRPIKKIKNGNEIIEYIEVTLEDIEAANVIVNEIMGTSLDELPPQTRCFLEIVSKMVKEHCREEKQEQSQYLFSRKMIRDYSGWSDFQVKIHIQRLVDLEYVIAHSGCRGSRYLYELAYSDEGKDGKSFFMGLIDVEKLKQS